MRYSKIIYTLVFVDYLGEHVHLHLVQAYIIELNEINTTIPRYCVNQSLKGRLIEESILE